MSLVYSKEVVTQPEIRKRVDVTLTAPKEWGMFSRVGDRSITSKAETLLIKLEASRIASNQEKALLSFLRAYRRMHKNPKFAEADDTDVREQVWNFFEKACRCVGRDQDDADKLWAKER